MFISLTLLLLVSSFSWLMIVDIQKSPQKIPFFSVLLFLFFGFGIFSLYTLIRSFSAYWFLLNTRPFLELTDTHLIVDHKALIPLSEIMKITFLNGPNKGISITVRHFLAKRKNLSNLLRSKDELKLDFIFIKGNDYRLAYSLADELKRRNPLIKKSKFR